MGVQGFAWLCHGRLEEGTSQIVLASVRIDKQGLIMREDYR